MLTCLLQSLKGKNSVRSATGILAVTLLASNILGVIRDHFLAQKIPADSLDVYYAAFRWPDLLFNIIILGAVSSAFIPIFSSLLEKDKQKAVAVANTLVVIIGLGLIILASLLALYMPFLIRLIAPGFTTEKIQLTIFLARVLLIGPFFFSLSYILSGMLQSWHRFFIPSLSPLIYNVSIIGATIFFADRLGVVGVTFGVVIGTILHAGIQIPQALKLGWRLNHFVKLNDERIIKIFRLMLPRALGLGVNQIMLLAFTSFASTLSAGAIALYNLADNIQTTPTVIFSNSIASALFPVLSRSHARNDQREFSAYIERSLLAVLLLLIPAAVGIILLRSEIVRIVLGSGYFGWEETSRAALALGGFAIGIPFTGVIPLLSKAYYARENTLLPALIATVGSLLSIVFGYFISSRSQLDVMGLSVAFSIGSMATALILYISIRKYITFDLAKMTMTLIHVLVGTIIMSIFVQFTIYIIDTHWFLRTGLAVLGQLSAAMIVGLVTYFGYLKLSNIDIIWPKKS